MARRMNQLERRVVGLCGLPDAQTIPGPGLFELRDDRPEPIRPLGVSRAGIVPQERVGVGEAGFQLVLLAVPGERRGTGCMVGRSR